MNEKKKNIQNTEIFNRFKKQLEQNKGSFLNVNINRLSLNANGININQKNYEEDEGNDLFCESK